MVNRNDLYLEKRWNGWQLIQYHVRLPEQRSLLLSALIIKSLSCGTRAELSLTMEKLSVLTAATECLSHRRDPFRPYWQSVASHPISGNPFRNMPTARVIIKSDLRSAHGGNDASLPIVLIIFITRRHILANACILPVLTGLGATEHGGKCVANKDRFRRQLPQSYYGVFALKSRENFPAVFFFDTVGASFCHPDLCDLDDSGIDVLCTVIKDVFPIDMIRLP